MRRKLFKHVKRALDPRRMHLRAIAAATLLSTTLLLPRLDVASGQSLGASNGVGTDGAKRDLVNPDREGARHSPMQSFGKGGKGKAMGGGGGYLRRMEPRCFKNPSKSGDKLTKEDKLLPKIEGFTFGDGVCKRYVAMKSY